ncbi:hypothetical protein BLNAU_684 [Blattamonas nauphoetae]|uniref:F-box domain-containing protein n=1 Tax=Blattamonas nauphoetae TaxID=2049346 RepID=A0ABQ9YK77_9EUKA|nr:hypothetical protein BLNAU_684 [Blattamonas nauphoetae]
MDQKEQIDFSSSIDSLPDIVIDELLPHCDLQTLLALQLTSKRFYLALKDEYMWQNAFLGELLSIRQEYLIEPPEWNPLSQFEIQNANDSNYLNSYGLLDGGLKDSLKFYIQTVRTQDTGKERITKKTRKYRSHVSRFVFSIINAILSTVIACLGCVCIGFTLQAQEIGTRTTFLDYWISSAVCISLALVFFVLAASTEDEDTPCLTGAVLIMAVLLIDTVFLVPAFWLDGIFTSSHWFGFIPISLILLLLEILIVVQSIRTALYGWVVMLVHSPIWIAGYVLSILKLDGVINVLWSVVMSPFFFVAFSIPFAAILCRSCPQRVRWCDAVALSLIVGISVTLILLFPTLRADHVLKGHFHFSLIPLYLVSVVFLICGVVYVVWACRKIHHLILRFHESVAMEITLGKRKMVETIKKAISKEA